MTLPVLASDPGQIEQVADPVGYVRIEILPDSRPPQGDVSVYIAYGGGDAVLYIGRSTNVRRRLTQHRLCRASWWTDVAVVRVIAGLTYDEAVAIERACIEAGGPRDNVHYNRGMR
jgi:hypothetical protein